MIRDFENITISFTCAHANNMIFLELLQRNVMCVVVILIISCITIYENRSYLSNEVQIDYLYPKPFRESEVKPCKTTGWSWIDVRSVAQMPRCRDAQKPRSPDAQKHRCPEAQMPRCRDAQMPGCPDAQMPRCPDGRMPRCSKFQS